MSKKINKRKGRNGFTLFELLVSISIIAVLTAVSVVSFGGLNKKTRDARRLADLEKIRVALESIKQIGVTYPASVGYTANLTGYLDRWPLDPKSNLPYRYWPPTGSTYMLCATVELTSSTTPDVTGCAADTSGFAGYNKVVNP